MDYSDAVAAFFSPRPDDTPLPAAVTAGSPARRLRDGCEPVAMHAVWSPGTNAALAGLGLNLDPPPRFLRVLTGLDDLGSGSGRG